MKAILSFLFLFAVLAASGQQQATVKGILTNEKTGQRMIAVNISVDGKAGGISDNDGTYTLTLDSGEHVITFSFVGYEMYSETLSLESGAVKELDIRMQESTQLLDEVVVSAGRYEQKLSEVTVSMEVLKSEQFSTQNITSLDQILEKTSGIDILNGQPSIRGGSGFSYGAGSRVLMLVDDMPLMSGDAGDIKWSYLPVENIKQVEVIKGASSVLYGSSALNGVIHMRNKFPGEQPETEITVFGGAYMKPVRKELIWKDQSPLFGGASFSHLRKIGNLDIIFSGNYYQNDGYRETEYEKRGRANLNLRYRSKKVPGLALGLSGSTMALVASDFLLWQNADSGAYRQNPATYFPYSGLRYNIDPYAEYQSKKGDKFSLKTRYYSIGRVAEGSTKNNLANSSYADFRYQKSFNNGIVWSTGTSLTQSQVVANLYDTHSSANYAIYSQLDARLGTRLKLSGGVRWEKNQIDGQSYSSLPVFRSGVNYQLSPTTFFRSSFGQGYRFPSLAEKYANTNVGGLRIFPNADLNPERGWSAELGVKQGFSLGNWRGLADLALYQTQYRNMIEYNFGLYLPDTILIPSFDYMGFKALNIGNARISGAELTLMAEATYSSFSIRFATGYTYMKPIDLDKLLEVGLEPDAYILKYRHKHSFKGDMEVETKRFLMGTGFSYSSRMVSVDEVFMDPFFGNLFLPGYPEYRKTHDSAYLLMDLRLAWKISEFLRVNLIVRNLLNKEYIGRPGDLGAPRNLTLQLRVKF